MKRITKPAIFAATVLLLSFGSAFANDRGLSADRVIAAIQTAVAANPGLIQEVEVDREGGRLIVEVQIISADGRQIEVKVDPEKNAVMR
jgi:Peptidase propeptide and YPEB domain